MKAKATKPQIETLSTDAVTTTPTEGDGRFATIYEFLCDERFIALRQRADNELFLWEDLDACPLPAGFTKEQTWALLTAVRRQTAIVLPWDTFMDKGYSAPMWYTSTRALTSRIERIEASAHRTSALTRAVSEHRGTVPLFDLTLRDIEAAFRTSGCPAEIVRGAKALEVAPAAVRGEARSDRVLANFLDLLNELPDLKGRRITVGFIEELHYRLLEGVEDFAPEELVIAPLYAESVYHDPDVCLKTIASIAQGCVSVELHPVLRATALYWFFLVCRPLPSWNSLVELLVRRLMLLQSDYPVLAMVPLAQLSEGWIQNNSAHRSSADMRAHLPEFEDDSTAWFLIYEDLFLDGLALLAERVEVVEQADERLEAAVQGQYLNYRQRAILSNAVRDPASAQKIEPHRRSYRIAYSTARADFLTLVDLGFLRMEEQGKAFVFRPGPKLLEIMG